MTEPHRYDVLAVVDCGDLERTGLFTAAPPPVTLVVNIDHHLTNRGFGGLNWIVSQTQSNVSFHTGRVRSPRKSRAVSG